MFLFAEEIIVYIANNKESTKTLLYLVSKFSKVTVLNVQTTKLKYSSLLNHLKKKINS